MLSPWVAGAEHHLEIPAILAEVAEALQDQDSRLRRQYRGKEIAAAQGAPPAGMVQAAEALVALAVLRPQVFPTQDMAAPA